MAGMDHVLYTGQDLLTDIHPVPRVGTGPPTVVLIPVTPVDPSFRPPTLR